MIDASLFAHIENDSSLRGRYKLEGNQFSNVTAYLGDYLKQLSDSGEPFPPAYSTFLEQMRYLTDVEQKIKGMSSDRSNERVKKLAASIAEEIMAMPQDKQLFLPSGWRNGSGGHSMMSRFAQTEHGFEFTVINAGGGINYHAKKSSKEKELYNPTKKWHFPRPKNEKEKAELAHFIERLLKTKMPSLDSNLKKRMTADKMYKEVLSSISYISGEEIDANVGFPEHAYTAGQLSGTCSQRVIHQMLKIQSPDSKTYQQFIFKFKLHALQDYSEACFSGQQPFNTAVAKQLQLAVENNLKILNTPGLFAEKEIKEYENQLLAVKRKVLDQPIKVDKDAKKEPSSSNDEKTFKVNPSSLAYHRSSRDSHAPIPKYVQIDLKNGNDLLNNLKAIIGNIKKIPDSAAQYHYLEQLILALPLNPQFKASSGFYRELLDTNDLEQFQQQLDEIQKLVLDLRKEWLDNKQIPAINVILLSILNLQNETYDAISTANKLPSFSNFSETMMKAILGNQDRNVYMGTNNPLLDQRIETLRNHYSSGQKIYNNGYYTFLIALLRTESQLYDELKALYYSEGYGQKSSELHEEIRSNKLEALFMLQEHQNYSKRLDSRFQPLIQKFETYMRHESRLRQAVNPFFERQLGATLHMDISNNRLLVHTALYPAHVYFQELSTKFSESKYTLEDSPARDALDHDVSKDSIFENRITHKSDNDIQLQPVKKTEADSKVTQADILARDYFHLRSVPKFQIPLTLDYFTRNIGKLSNESNQRYVEANLFQPGLLLNAAKDPAFLPQLDTFLKTGHKFHSINGQHTRASLFFVRMDFLASRYLMLNNDPAGFIRLKSLQNELVKQLSLATDPDVTYVMQQYLFLTLMARMEQGEQSDVLFTMAYKAFFYMNSHTNPNILNDKAHSTEVERCVAQFQILTSRQQPHLVQNAIIKALRASEQMKDVPVLNGTFPRYTLDNYKKGGEYTIDALAGQLFENNAARTGVPLKIQNHRLTRHLGMSHVRECLISGDSSRMVLADGDEELHLFYSNNQLTAQKVWAINGTKNTYELQALTREHDAFQANSNIDIVQSHLPNIFRDASMDFWRDVNNRSAGLLVKNGKPLYLVNKDKLVLLDSQGNETAFHLSPHSGSPLNQFESSGFIVSHKGPEYSQVMLPRYHLNFDLKGQDIINQETSEKVVDRESPIHPSVAGLIMAKNQYERYVVPVSRFYATKKNTRQGDFYSVIHDTSARLVEGDLRAHPDYVSAKEKPLWQYTDSERSISFRLKDGEPVADSVADTLYLAYMYLVTDQPEKGWNMLEECTTRFGGLTGDPAELQFISWICNELPAELPGKKKDKYSKDTPPYVASKLKAMSLVCDYLGQGGTFEQKKSEWPKQTANAMYDELQQKQQQRFITELPDTLYEQFSRLQSMRRHLEHTYTLSSLERKHLLAYYHQRTGNGAPKGTLGFEWMNLSLEALLEEQNLLLARHAANETLPTADKHRLDFIERKLKKLQAVTAQSSAIERVAINLDLPLTAEIHRANLGYGTLKDLERWHHKLPGEDVSTTAMTRAIESLSSDISEDDFIIHFQAYLQLACTSDYELNKDESKRNMRKTLMDFCTKTLIAKRHLSLLEEESNIPLLSNILYRTLNNSGVVSGKTLKFNELVKELHEVTVPDLEVYQAVDVYQGILATPEELRAQQKSTKPVPLAKAKNATAPLLVQTGMAEQLKLNAPLKIELDSLIKRYNALEEQGDKDLATLAATLNQDQQKSLVVENKAGTVLFNLEQEKKALAEELIKNPNLVQAILTANTSASALLQDNIKTFWSEALALANEGPADPVRARTWTIEKQAQSRPELTRADLQSIYLRADLTFSIEKTGLSPEKAQMLHQAIHKALVEGIRHQALKKIATDLNKAVKTQNANAAAQALDVLTRQEIPALDKPAVVLIQHEDKILLRKRQTSALISLLQETGDERRFKERVEKIIPGGGKSKVILPIVAELKATGDNLVVVEVPRPLLATNHVDLNSTSQHLFGKRAYRFEFNRDSDCSPERLEQLYQMLTEIMTTRSYMVTTGESIQSLESKYIELLLSTNEHDVTWKQQVYWCDKITTLFRHHADCIIDEVHQGLSTKKKLNYTSGEAKPLDPLTIKNATALFSLISTEFIKAAPSLDLETYDWTPFKLDLVNRLIHDTNSPLKDFVTRASLRYGEGVRNELIAYLSNQAKTLPQAIEEATPDERSSFGFFKEEINVRLQQTLPQQLNKKFGPSKKPGITPVEKTLAIPYAANNVPNERNRIAEELEAINKTIQQMLLQGISEELLTERVAEWQALARQELFRSEMLTHLDETPTAHGFALLTQGLGLKLSQMNIDNKAQMKALHKHLHLNRPLMFDFLREYSLKLIQKDSAIIPNDNFNHVDQYRSVQGVSGTPPSNPTTYHRRLSYDKSASLGTDGYILEVVRHKKPAISGHNYLNPNQYLAATLGQSKSEGRARSITDINGTFTGVTNLDVALELAAYIKQHPGEFTSPLKYVLYFNEEQVLCAVDVNNPENIIILRTSDTEEINRLLNCEPVERFTYYDQLHTTGTDIAQYEYAHFLVLVDDKTTMDEFKQGTMRARELPLGQTMEIITPQRLNKIVLEGLYSIFDKNSTKNAHAEAPFAARGQMKNYVRRQFLSLIQDLPSEEAEKKAALMKHFKPFFADTPSLDFFALYGGINKKQAIAEILKQYKLSLTSLWEQCRNNAEMKLYEADIKELNKTLEDIITQAIPYCLAEYEGLDNSEAQGMEVQKEIQKEVEIEVLTLNETYNSRRSSSQKRSWYYSPSTGLINAGLENMYLSLNTLCETNTEKPNLFSPELRASTNYAYTYQEQEQSLGVFLKPVFLVWYHMEKGQLHAMIVTPQEAENLQSRFKEPHTDWIATTLDTVVAGTRPEGMLQDVRYQSLREQVRFFNGEFAGLMNQDTPLIWLKEQRAEKLAFYEKNLLPYRPGSASEFNLIRMAATSQDSTAGLVYIASHPFEDLSQFNWLRVLPKTSPAQEAEYKKLAEAFVYLNKNWQASDITIDSMQQKFDLPLNNLTYLNGHLQYLMAVKRMRELIKNSSVERPFLLHLSAADTESVERSLGMSLKQLYEMQGTTPPAASGERDTQQINEASAASVKAAMLLHASPALEHDNVLAEYFASSAKQVRSTDILLDLLNTRSPSVTLISNLIENPLFDAHLFMKIFEQGTRLTAGNLLVLAAKCKTPAEEELIDAYFEEHPPSNQLLTSLVTEYPLSSSMLKRMLKHVTSEGTLESIGSQKTVNEELFKELLRHPMSNTKVLQSWLNARPFSNDELEQVLTNSPVVTEDVLKQIMEMESINKAVFSSIIQHPAMTPEVLSKAFKHQLFTPETAGSMMISITQPLIRPLFSEIMEQHKKAKDKVWEPLFVSLIAKLDDIGALKQFTIRHGEEWGPIGPPVSRRFFDRLGPSAGKYLLLDDMTLLLELLKATNKLNSKNLLILAKNPLSPIQIDTLLKQRNCNSEVLAVLLEHESLDGAALLKIAEHQNITPKLMIEISKHKLMSPQILGVILLRQQKRSLDESTFDTIARVLFERYKEERSSDLEECIYGVYFHKAIHHHSLTFFDQWKELISPQLGLRIFRSTGERTLPYLPPLLDMAKIAGVGDLDPFINLDMTLSPEILAILTAHPLNSAQIDKLLAREDMTTVIGTTLISKKEFSGTLKPWKWMTEEYLLAAVDKTVDYSSFLSLRDHPGLPRKSLADWLDLAHELRKESSRGATTDNNEELKLRAFLQSLKIQAMKHAIRANLDSSDNKVIEAAFDLYKKLLAETNNHFDQITNRDIKQLKSKCKTTLDMFVPVLQAQHGYKQAIKDITNILALTDAPPKTGFKFFAAPPAVAPQASAPGDIDDLGFSDFGP